MPKSKKVDLVNVSEHRMTIARDGQHFVVEPGETIKLEESYTTFGAFERADNLSKKEKE